MGLLERQRLERNQNKKEAELGDRLKGHHKSFLVGTHRDLSRREFPEQHFFKELQTDSGGVLESELHKPPLLYEDKLFPAAQPCHLAVS